MAGRNVKTLSYFNCHTNQSLEDSNEIALHDSQQPGATSTINSLLRRQGAIRRRPEAPPNRHIPDVKAHDSLVPDPCGCAVGNPLEEEDSFLKSPLKRQGAIRRKKPGAQPNRQFQEGGIYDTCGCTGNLVEKQNSTSTASKSPLRRQGAIKRGGPVTAPDAQISDVGTYDSFVRDMCGCFRSSAEDMYGNPIQVEELDDSFLEDATEDL